MPGVDGILHSAGKYGGFLKRLTVFKHVIRFSEPRSIDVLRDDFGCSCYFFKRHGIKVYREYAAES